MKKLKIIYKLFKETSHFYGAEIYLDDEFIVGSFGDESKEWIQGYIKALCDFNITNNKAIEVVKYV